MIDTARITKSVAPRELNDVRRANRSLLTFYLVPFPLAVVLAAWGVSDAIILFVSSIVVLMALQYLLKGTTNSPLEVLKRYREISLTTAVGLTILMLVMDEGLLTFAATFAPRLYNVLNEIEFTANSSYELTLLFISAAVLIPFYEEVIFRGLALNACRNARSTLFAVLFTSILFAFIHGSLIQAFFIFPSAILFALVVLKTGQLWTVIAVHALGNFFATLHTHFDVPTLPTTPALGILGLTAATIAFWMGFRWLAPNKMSWGGATKGAKIWTFSLVTVLIIALLLNVITTYEALAA